MKDYQARLLAEVKRLGEAKRYYREKHREIVDRTDAAILDALDAGVDADDITIALGHNLTYRPEVIRRAMAKREAGKI